MPDEPADRRQHPRRFDYGLLLLLLLAYLISLPIFSKLGGWAEASGVSVLYTAIVTALLKAVWANRKLFSSLLIAGSLSIVLRGIMMFHPALPLAWEVTDMLLGIVICGIGAVAIVVDISRRSRLSPDILVGAGCAYLLIALAWSCIFMLCLAFDPQSIVSNYSSTELAAGTVHDYKTVIYFSLATLTTLGYGDIVPASGLARILAVLEAANGVLLLTLLMGRLVSSYVGAKVPVDR